MGMFLEHGSARKYKGGSKWDYPHIVPWKLAGNSCPLTAKNGDKILWGQPLTNVHVCHHPLGMLEESNATNLQPKERTLLLEPRPT